MSPVRRLFVAWLLCLPLVAVQAAQTPPVPIEEELPDEIDGLKLMDAVVVSGVQPGPGLWKVSRAGSDNVMWVLGGMWPLPKRMEWNTLPLERHIARAGVVLMPPSVKIEAEGAALGGIFLLPSLMSARNNPGKEKLQDVLPAADYARWTRLKATYLGRDRGVEKRRPILAAIELRDKALDAHDLSQRDIVARAVTQAAKKADVPLQRPRVTLVVQDAKAVVKEFAAGSLDDTACFRKILDQVENDLDTLAQRANAWALGDIAELRALTYTDVTKTCTDALLQSGLAQSRGFAELPARAEAAWLADAEKALATHPESVAMLSMTQVLGPSGYLAKLEQRGYTIESPETQVEDAATGTQPTDGD